MDKRLQGWEKSLADFIESLKDQPFKRGVFDCAMMAGKCCELLTGADFTSEFVGDYKTKADAYKFLQSIGYETLADIPTKFFGEPYASAKMACRGDVVLIEKSGQEALGVVDLSGRRAVTFDTKGLTYYKMEFWSKAWKV